MAMKGNRIKQTGSQRANAERKRLEEINLLAYAEGFTRITRKPIDRAFVELEVNEPDDGLIQLEVVVGLHGDFPGGETGVHVWISLDPLTGNFEIEPDIKTAITSLGNKSPDGRVRPYPHEGQQDQDR